MKFNKRYIVVKSNQYSNLFWTLFFTSIFNISFISIFRKKNITHVVRAFFGDFLQAQKSKSCCKSRGCWFYELKTFIQAFFISTIITMISVLRLHCGLYEVFINILQMKMKWKLMKRSLYNIQYWHCQFYNRISFKKYCKCYWNVYISRKRRFYPIFYEVYKKYGIATFFAPNWTRGCGLLSLQSLFTHQNTKLKYSNK